MMLTAGHIAEVFDIFGVTNKTTYFGGTQLANVFGPAGEDFTMEKIKDKLNAAITALTTAEELLFTETDGIIDQWDCVKFAAETIIEDSGTRGTLFDHKKVREVIRQRAAGLLGFAVPRGGFMKQFERIARQAGGAGGSLIR